MKKLIKIRNCIIHSFLLCLYVNNVFGQMNDFVQSDGIKTESHKNNIGKIFFLNKQISTPQLSQTDFLNSYTLTNKSNLFFVAFFDNSLTNYLHRLAPELSADSLVKIGNFQFTLFVDEKEIYRSNLLPRAPQPKFQNTATLLNRAFIDNLNGQGSWSESFWNRFLNNGGEKALTDGQHKLKIEIRPYIKSNTLKVGDLLASGEIVLEVLRNPKIDGSKYQLNRLGNYNGLQVSKETFDSLKIKELKGNIEEGIFKKINSVVVLKNGKILIEEYFNNENRNTLHDTRSVGKSFTSALIGIGIKDGFLKDETQPIRDFYSLPNFKNYQPEKEKITIHQLLSMSSGFDGNDEDETSVGNEENMYPTENWIKFTLDLPYQANYANQWHYFTAGLVLMGDIMNKSVKGGLEKYADEKLFKPLGIRNYEWQYTPQNVPNTAGGIKMNALDFAKFGQLYKNKGVWNKEQILEKSWVEKTFTKHQKIVGREDEFYGYLFWNKKFTVNNKAYEANYCAGNGGNYILIFKDQPLVVVITASAYGQPYAHTQVHKMLTEYILPAVSNK